MGVYHFMLSGALKGFVSEAVQGRVPHEQFIYVVIFCSGCLVGILSFARLLSYLFRHHESTTLAAMVGLMLGSLRAIWPFRYGDASVGIVPFLPDSAGPWLSAGIALVVGFALVAGMTWLAERLEAEKGTVLPGSE
jgi:putative membrane protein